MKVYLISILFIIYTIGNNRKTVDEFQQQETENFDWMIGEWTRINGKKEIMTTEKWEKTPGNIYTGTGLSVKKSENVFRENLRLLRKNGKWIYEVTGVNADTTNFILTSISANSFTAVNPDNPFPKKINYQAENGKLIAEISDDEKKILFEFKKSHQK